MDAYMTLGMIVLGPILIPMERLRQTNPKKHDRIVLTVLIVASLFLMFQFWRIGPEESRKFAWPLLR